MLRAPWVGRAAPKRVRALECEHHLRHVGLGDNHSAGVAELLDHLQTGMLAAVRSGSMALAHTNASDVLDLFAHCVKPIEESNPVMSSAKGSRIEQSLSFHGRLTLVFEAHGDAMQWTTQASG